MLRFTCVDTAEHSHKYLSVYICFTVLFYTVFVVLTYKQKQCYTITTEKSMFTFVTQSLNNYIMCCVRLRQCSIVYSEI